jgi:pyroglutamyl-peptidase
VFATATSELLRQIRKHRPAAVLCLGLANGRKEITPERVAINIDDARIPDNAGAQPRDRSIVRGGAPAYFSTLPIKEIVVALQAQGIPAGVSNTAGTFVCNHLFYGLMSALGRNRAVRGGFIHVPCSPQLAKAGEPSLPLATMIEGIALAVETTLATNPKQRARRTPTPPTRGKYRRRTRGGR